MEHPRARSGRKRVQRRIRRPAQDATALAAEGQHHLAREHRLDAARAGQVGSQAIARRLQRCQRGAVLYFQADHPAHPQEVVAPFQARHLVERQPTGGAVLRLVPCAIGKRTHAKVGAGQVLGAAQGWHARKRAPGAFAAERFAIDDAQVAHAVALEPVGGGLAAHAGTHDQDIEQGLAVRSVAWRHPVGSGEIESRQVVARLFFKQG